MDAGNNLTVKNELITALDTSILNNLVTQHDFETIFQELDKGSSSFLWAKADLLLHMYKTLGFESLIQLSENLNISATKIVAYVRTSKAFPPEKRNINLSFSHHTEASYADSYSKKSGSFNGEKRFKLLAEAEEKKISTRELKQLIKRKDDNVEVIHACFRCPATENVRKYILLSTDKVKKPETFSYCDNCYQEILNFIHKND